MDFRGGPEQASGQRAAPDGTDSARPCTDFFRLATRKLTGCWRVSARGDGHIAGIKVPASRDFEGPQCARSPTSRVPIPLVLPIGQDLKNLFASALAANRGPHKPSGARLAAPAHLIGST
jgi:hypothetical protein